MAELIERYRLPLALALVVILTVGLGAFLARRLDVTPVAVLPPTPVAKIASPAPAPQPVKIYITGAVINPGVYTLSEGDRVEDALRLAGGPTTDADLVRINLAVRLRDQLQIDVPRLTPASQDSPAQAAPRSAPTVRPLVNVNTALEPELDTLPGIGPATAQRIISYREQHGPFNAIDDLKNSRLVNAATFEKIKDLIVAR